MNAVEYDQPNSQELLEEANTAFSVAQSFQVTSAGTYEIAAGELAEVKLRVKELTERRMSITRKLDDAKSAIMDLFRPALSRLEETKVFYERGMLAYATAQEAAKRAEQARLEAIAAEEREKLAAAAKAAEKAGNVEEAEALTVTAEMIIAAPAVIEAPAAQGTFIRKTWKGRCVDKFALIQFIAADQAYVDLVSVDAVALNALAKSQKQNMKVGGCESYQESSISSRQK